MDPPSRAKWLLISLWCTLMVLHLGSGALYYYDQTPERLAAYRLLNIGGEVNVPTLVASLLWLSAAFLCVTLSRSGSRSGNSGKYWLGIAGVSLYIGIDELMIIHERAIPLMHRLVPGLEGGSMHYAWVIPYAVPVLVVMFVFVRFVLGLDRRVSTRIIVAGSVFILGAMGLETIGGALEHGRDGTHVLVLTLSYTLEESLEFAGVSLFVHALVLQRHIHSHRASQVVVRSHRPVY